MDFDLSRRAREWRDRLIGFFDAEVLSRHPAWLEHIRQNQQPAFMGDLQRKARAAGLWNLALPDLAPEGMALVAYQENYGSIANNFLAASPAHPVILRALDLAATALNRGDKDFVWLSTGPGLITRATAQVLAEDEDGTVVAGILVRELHEMRWLVEIHCPVDYKSTRAHWSRAVFARLNPRADRTRKGSPSDRNPAA